MQPVNHRIWVGHFFRENADSNEDLPKDGRIDFDNFILPKILIEDDVKEEKPKAEDDVKEKSMKIPT